MKSEILPGAALIVFAFLMAACSRTAPPVAMSASSDSPSGLPSWAASYDESVKSDLARVRDATADFHDVAAAHAVGYPTAMPQCLENQPHGGMGLHYMKRDLLDTSLDVEHPEILVYAPAKDGKPKLVGVEYIVPYSAWDREKQAPTIFGQNLKRSDELKIWYLHVWAWEPNEKGLFDDWNPAVTCGG
jgi:hypothetical protein